MKLKNEKVKRKYIEWLKDAQGYSELTVQAIEKALWKYEEYSREADYGNFDSKDAQLFKKYLAVAKNPQSGNSLSLTSQYHILRHVNAFFLWLSGQTGYKSRIKSHDVRYLRLSKEESRVATAPKLPKYPTIEYIKKLCDFNVESEMDMRDRAMIAFTALSGMRDRAIITLPVGCFDEKELVVYQEPARGVKTKFSKSILTVLFRFDTDLLNFVLDWVGYLRKEKLFTDEDPMFPSTEVEIESSISQAFVAKGIEKVFWKNAGAMRKIFQKRAKEMGLEYFSPHKFRHFAISEAQKYVYNPEQLKAVSQSVGHQNLSTTFFSYGGMAPERVKDVITGMDFDKKKPKKQEMKDQLKDILSKLDNMED